jgi:hypothetical protein
MVERLVDLNLADVPTKGDDFDPEKLGAMLLKSGVVNTTAEAVKTHAPKPGGAPGLVFCATVEQAELTSTALRGLGYSASCLDGGASPKEREDMVQALRSGKLQVLTNCHVLTEGFDCPAISWVVFARPFKSLSLYFQAAGRALRPDPSKPKGEPATLINLTPHAPRSLSLPPELLQLLSRLLPPPPAPRPAPEPAAPVPAPIDVPEAPPPGGVAGLSGLLSTPRPAPVLAPSPLPAGVLRGLSWPPHAPAPVLAVAGPGVALLAPLAGARAPAPEASGAPAGGPSVEALPLLGALSSSSPEAPSEAPEAWVGWWFSPHPSGGVATPLPVPLARSPLPFAALLSLAQGFADHAHVAEVAAARAGRPTRSLPLDHALDVATEWLESGLWTVML